MLEVTNNECSKKKATADLEGPLQVDVDIDNLSDDADDDEYIMDMEKLEEDAILDSRLMEDDDLFSVSDDDSASWVPDDDEKKPHAKERASKRRKVDEHVTNSMPNLLQNGQSASMPLSLVSQIFAPNSPTACAKHPVNKETDEINAGCIITGLEQQIAALQKEINCLHKNVLYNRSETRKLRQSSGAIPSLNQPSSAADERSTTKALMNDCIETACSFSSVLASYSVAGISDAFLNRSCKRLAGIIWDEKVWNGRLFLSLM
ncbi:hypothetical protein ACA910_018468 [Epithemia clementina (nom. ined.)]